MGAPVLINGTRYKLTFVSVGGGPDEAPGTPRGPLPVAVVPLASAQQPGELYLVSPDASGVGNN
jgi:hypothetical protein